MSTHPPDRAGQAAPHEDAPQLSEEMIESFRRTGIRLDREGRLWHEGAEIEHAGLRRALLRWLDRRDDGRPILRLDAQRYAYIDVEDADLLALSARWDGDRAWLRLSDETEVELDYASLESGADNALYCRVRGGRLTARITTPAYYVLAERIRPVDEDADTDEGTDESSFVLDACGRVFPIRQRQ
ncbi:MAG TPA: hypothetical protein VNM90_18350 [Haliangium sp.]|nr:hypothetical protein [Haliangium sp.]